MSKRLELVPLTTYQFIGNGNTIQDIQLIKYIPTEGFLSGLFELRALNRSLAAGQIVALVLQPISLAEDEPEATYATATGEIVAAVTSATTVPGFIPVNLTAPVPAAYRLLVRGTQPVGVTTAFNATVSASLTLRDA